MPLVAPVGASVVVAVDQLSKTWALHHLAGRPPRHVLWTLQLNLSLNSGIAFGLGQGAGGLVVPVAVVVVAAVLLVSRSLTGPMAWAAVGLVLGGAVGNLVDRLLRHHGGAVIDFIDLQWWPIFNVADSAIVVGGVLLAVAASRARRPVPE